MRYKIKEWIRNWLGATSNEYSIRQLRDLLVHEKSSIEGFIVLKRHLQRPDRPLPRYRGKEIEQD